MKGNRARLDRDLQDSRRRQLFSGGFLSQYRVTVPLIERYASGRTIDLGCGEMPYREVIVARVAEYHSLDLFRRPDEVTYVGDIQDMWMIPAETYDTALCLEVLEHVPDPSKAISEIRRILRTDGILIVSVPHLSRLHNEPHDYYRYTKYGVRYLLEHGGLEVLALKERGGLWSFVGHQASTLLLSAVWGIPVVKEVALAINSLLITRPLYAIDGFLNPSGMFAMGYTAVARKAPRLVE